MHTPRVLSVFTAFFVFILVFILNTAYGGYSYEGKVDNGKGEKTTAFKLSSGINGVIIITGYTPEEPDTQANAADNEEEAGNEEKKAAASSPEEPSSQEEADQEKEEPDKTATPETNEESPQNAASRALSFYSNQSFTITPLAAGGWFSISASANADGEGTSTSSVYLRFSTTQGEQAPDYSLLNRSYSHLTQTDSSDVNREATRTLAATLMNPQFLQQLQEMMRQNPVRWYHPSTTRLGTAIRAALGRYFRVLSSHARIEITEPVSNSELAMTGNGYVLEDEENGVTLSPQSETVGPRRVFVSLATPGTYEAYANGAVASTSSNEQKDETKDDDKESKGADKESKGADKESKEADKETPEACNRTGIFRAILGRIPFLGPWLVQPQTQPSQSKSESPNSDSSNDNQDEETKEEEPEEDKPEATHVDPSKIPKEEVPAPIAELSPQAPGTNPVLLLNSDTKL